MRHDSKLIKKDILAYLKKHESKKLLRFITCGSVDDGKSTLIGRLLYDSHMILKDQLASIAKHKKHVDTKENNIDLALLVDGLQSEREQGITIDVAYRYFSTDTRKFIIADTPGHEQYTRNMVTGASTSDLAIILIDASKGIQTQTRRHSFICSLLGIRNIIVAINKMDMINYSQKKYETIKSDYLKLIDKLDILNISFVTISALNGENIIKKSNNLSWFRGSTLMECLENTQVIQKSDNQEFRLPIQLVCRPSSKFRGFQGSIASGEVQVGDTIRVLPSGKVTKIKSIETFDGEIESASQGLAVTITTTDEVDISRGDMVVHKDKLPHLSSKLRASVVWMSEKPLETYKDYNISFATKSTLAIVTYFHHKINFNTLQEEPCRKIDLNEIATLDLQMVEEVAFDKYKENRETGAFIIIDKLTNMTVGAGMIEEPLISNTYKSKQQYSEFEIEFNTLVRKYFPHWQAKDLNLLS